MYHIVYVQAEDMRALQQTCQDANKKKATTYQFRSWDWENKRTVRPPRFATHLRILAWEDITLPLMPLTCKTRYNAVCKIHPGSVIARSLKS